MSEVNNQPKVPQITKVSYGLVTANAGEQRKLEHRAKVAGKEALRGTIIVKVYLDALPEVTNSAFELLLDEEPVRKYTFFEKGIFFKLFDQQGLARLSKARLWFRRHGDPDEEQWKSLREAGYEVGEVPMEVLDAKELPTRAAFLQE